MVATRRSARIASAQGSQASSPPQSQTSPATTAGSKRKSEGGSSPLAKRGKKAADPEQKTLEETLPVADPEKEKPSAEEEKGVTKTDDVNKESAAQPPPASRPDKELAQTSAVAESKPQVDKQPAHTSTEAESKPEPAAQPGSASVEAEPKPQPHVQPVHTSAEAEPKPQPDAQPASTSVEAESKPQPEREPEPQPAQATVEADPKPQTYAQPVHTSAEAEHKPPPFAQPAHRSVDAEPKPPPDQEMTDADTAKEDTKPISNDQEEKKEPERSAPTSQPVAQSDNAVVEDARTEEEPSSILEKGVIYFVYRGRVGIDSPSEVQDIARSYIVLRPIPAGAKLGDGPIGDDHNCRLIAIPKKVLPLSGKDRWIGFVEKAKTTMRDLKENFLAASDYETQTAGIRHTPAAVPAAEGVYAITSTGRESHLAYIVTLPKSLGEVQNDLGLREQGSFIVSVKNPQYPGPANTNIGKDPGYSQDIMDTFRNLRWAPLRADMLDFEGCQFLLVGESSGLDNATQPQEDDQKQEKTDPREELETLGSEDAIRVKHLHNEDAVFKDLGTDAKSYPGLQTTW